MQWQVSLGQGQGPKAEKLLTMGMERGMWVCLQNCHLSQSWMPSLDRIVDNIDPEKVIFISLNNYFVEMIFDKVSCIARKI